MRRAGTVSVLRDGVRECMELSKMAFTLRHATVNDADQIANVYSASFRLLTFLPCCTPPTSTGGLLPT
jgi:hypothetical protein